MLEYKTRRGLIIISDANGIIKGGPRRTMRKRCKNSPARRQTQQQNKNDGESRKK